MLPREARWFAQQVELLGDEAIFPMLNVGSHTAEFRAKTQPWIDEELFRPFARRGCEVIHTDIQADEGVDLVGDLTDPQFQNQLRARRFRSVFCNNLLEHVTDPASIANALRDCVVPGGYLLLSVPYRFPYHPDPIDTMFRPSPEELHTLFPGTSIVVAKRLRCGNLSTYALMRMRKNSGAMIRTLGERLRGRTGADRALKNQPVQQSNGVLSYIPWLVRPFVITCLILRVNP